MQNTCSALVLQPTLFQKQFLKENEVSPAEKTEMCFMMFIAILVFYSSAAADELFHALLNLSLSFEFSLNGLYIAAPVGYVGLEFPALLVEQEKEMIVLLQLD